MEVVCQEEGQLGTGALHHFPLICREGIYNIILLLLSSPLSFIDDEAHDSRDDDSQHHK